MPSWSRFPNPGNRIIKTTQYVECLATESLLAEQIASLTWDNTLLHGSLYIRYRTKKTRYLKTFEVFLKTEYVKSTPFCSLPRSNNGVPKETIQLVFLHDLGNNACPFYSLPPLRDRSTYETANTMSQIGCGTFKSESHCRYLYLWNNSDVMKNKICMWERIHNKNILQHNHKI